MTSWQNVTLFLLEKTEMAQIVIGVQHTMHLPTENGIKLDECLSAFKDIQRNKTSIDLNPEDYPGGIELWGCALSVYDTINFELNPGIHVHARKEIGKEKEIDKSFGTVNVKLGDDYITFNDLESISYSSSNILKVQIKSIETFIPI